MGLPCFENRLEVDFELIQRWPNALGFERLRMGRGIAAALVKHGRHGGHALLESTDVYLFEFRHHHVGCVALHDSFEYFVLDDNLAQVPQMLVPLFHEGCLDLAIRFVRALDQLLEGGPDLRDCVYARV